MQFLVLHLKGKRWSVRPPYRALSVFKKTLCKQKGFWAQTWRRFHTWWTVVVSCKDTVMVSLNTSTYLTHSTTNPVPLQECPSWKRKKNLSWILNLFHCLLPQLLVFQDHHHGILHQTATPPLWQLSLLLQECTGNKCQCTQALTIPLHTGVQPSPQLLHPTVKPKQNRKLRKHQGQMQILFTPMAQAIYLCSTSAFYQELMIPNSTLWPTKVLNKLLPVFPNSILHLKTIIKEFIFTLLNNLNETKN